MAIAESCESQDPSHSSDDEDGYYDEDAVIEPATGVSAGNQPVANGGTLSMRQGNAKPVQYLSFLNIRAILCLYFLLIFLLMSFGCCFSSFLVFSLLFYKYFLWNILQCAYLFSFN